MNECGMTDMQFRSFLLLFKGNLADIKNLLESEKHDEAISRINRTLDTLSESINDLQ